MTTDHLTPEQKAAATFFPRIFDTHGCGYGVGVSTAPDVVSRVPGRYGWFGVVTPTQLRRPLLLVLCRG